MFRGYPALRGSNDKFEYSEELSHEILKCMDDPIYFIDYYICRLRDYQIGYIRQVHENKHVIAHIGRQLGESFAMAAYITWLSIFKNNQTIGILAPTSQDSIQCLELIKSFIVKLPLWIQQETVKWNNTCVKFNNGSKIFAEWINSKATRGQAVTFTYCNQFSRVSENNAVDFIQQILPTLTSNPNSKILITANVCEDSHPFCKIYRNSRDFVRVKMPYTLNKSFDAHWVQSMISLMSLEYFNAEFNCKFIEGA